MCPRLVLVLWVIPRPGGPFYFAFLGFAAGPKDWRTASLTMSKPNAISAEKRAQNKGRRKAENSAVVIAGGNAGGIEGFRGPKGCQRPRLDLSGWVR
jgi:hypothetical protein